MLNIQKIEKCYEQCLQKRLHLVAILLPLRISQQQSVRKETMDNGGYEKNIGEKVAAISPNMLQRMMQNFQ